MCLQNGRELGRIQNLIRIGVADTAQDTRIGQRPLQVRFSAIRATRKPSRSIAKTSMPPGSIECISSSLRNRWSEARRLAPASVSTSEPWGKSKATRLFRPPSFAPTGCQAARNHQVQDHPDAVIKLDGNSVCRSAAANEPCGLQQLQSVAVLSATRTHSPCVSVRGAGRRCVSPTN
jgi:hypothetical protein